MLVKFPKDQTLIVTSSILNVQILSFVEYDYTQKISL